MKQINKQSYTFNSHYHFNNKRSYESISQEMKEEYLEELIQMLEYQLLSFKGYDDDVIGLMMLVDDVEEIKVDDEEGLLKDRIEKTIYSLNLFSSWYEELRLKND